MHQPTWKAAARWTRRKKGNRVELTRKLVVNAVLLISRCVVAWDWAGYHPAGYGFRNQSSLFWNKKPHIICIIPITYHWKLSFNTRTPGIFITSERPMYHFWYKRGIPLLKCRWRLILAYYCFEGLLRPHIRLKIVNFSRKYKIKSRQIKKK